MKPILRFPEFKDEWKINKLGLYTNVIMGQSPSSKNYTNDSNNIVLVQGNADLQKGKIYPRIYTTEITKIAEMNDIILTVRAPVGELAISQMKVCIGRGVCAIKGNTFIYSYLNYLNDKNYWKRIVQGSTFESISGTDVKNVPLKIPSEEEQEKIGRFFNKLDQQIELEEKKLKLLEQQNKGYMQKIFSQELKFKDDFGNEYPKWETKLLGDITKTFSGGTPKSSNLSYYNGSIPFIRSGEISKQSTELKITEEALNNSSAKLVEKGDLLYALYGATSGEVAISKINGAINQAVLCIKTEESTYFLLNYLKLQKSHILNTYIQGGQGNLSASIVKGITIKVPCKEEQIKIGNFLEKINNLIEKQNLKIEQLKQRKNGLLQKMFI